MRNKHYKIKQFRLSEEVYAELLKIKKKSGETWNLLLKGLLQNDKTRNKH